MQAMDKRSAPAPVPPGLGCCLSTSLPPAAASVRWHGLQLPLPPAAAQQRCSAHSAASLRPTHIKHYTTGRTSKRSCRVRSASASCCTRVSSARASASELGIPDALLWLWCSVDSAAASSLRASCTCWYSWRTLTRMHEVRRGLAGERGSEHALRGLEHERLSLRHALARRCLLLGCSRHLGVQCLEQGERVSA